MHLICSKGFNTNNKILQRLKDLPIRLNTMKGRVIKLNFNIEEKNKKSFMLDLLCLL